MNVMKIVKIGLMASISSNLIHSDWCELCFSDYKEINPPESNLAEEAQKIKESKNKTENNGDENIKKTNINEFEDQSNTNYSNARKSKTDRNYTSNSGIIPEGIEKESIPEDINIDNRMYTNNGDTIENLKNNSSCERTYNKKTPGYQSRRLKGDRLSSYSFPLTEPIDAILVHTDAFTLSLLCKITVQRFWKPKFELTGVRAERIWCRNLNVVLHGCEEPFVLCIFSIP